MSSWFYLSFVDPQRPEGTKFIGGAYVEAQSFPQAVDRAWKLGINPGGEVKGLGPISSEEINQNTTPDERERLLSPTEGEWDAWDGGQS